MKLEHGRPPISLFRFVLKCHLLGFLVELTIHRHFGKDPRQRPVLLGLALQESENIADDFATLLWYH